MLTKEMINKLNTHMNLEFYSSNLYLQVSAWCKKNSFEGSSQFFLHHSKEEMNHMMKIFNYLCINTMPIINKIDAPMNQFNSLCDVLEKSYFHEQKITKKINSLVDDAFISKDYLTFNLLQWYVLEQQEEEMLFKNMIDRLLLFGNTSESLFLLDKEFEKHCKK